MLLEILSKLHSSVPLPPRLRLVLNQADVPQDCQKELGLGVRIRREVHS